MPRSAYRRWSTGVRCERSSPACSACSTASGANGCAPTSPATDRSYCNSLARASTTSIAHSQADMADQAGTLEQIALALAKLLQPLEQLAGDGDPVRALDRFGI